MFVAGMSGSELALARQAGLEPLGLVYGVVNRVSAAGGINVVGEQRRNAQAHLDALRLALQRMSEQAQSFGADGIADVAIELRVQVAPGSQVMRLIECRAAGTAVRDRAAPAGSVLWTAALSASEIWALRRTGYLPLAIVVGYGSIFANGDRWAARRQMRGQSARSINRNIELSWMAEALQQARRLALAGIEAEAQQAGAAGIVGLALEKRIHRAGTNSLIVDLQAIGTAITPLRRAAEHQLPALVMDMTALRRIALPAPQHAGVARSPAAATAEPRRDGEQAG
ncbi:MAG TPA: hypothetical protein VKV26_08580 [Dehalococcoidia bacterium]|nr:hypothetical protein [Dehalococcoidia bacterium]